MGFRFERGREAAVKQQAGKPQQSIQHKHHAYCLKAPGIATRRKQIGYPCRLCTDCSHQCTDQAVARE